MGRRSRITNRINGHYSQVPQGNELLPTEFSFPLLNVLLVAPAFEEFLMRGAILRNLQEEYSLLGS